MMENCQADEMINFFDIAIPPQQNVHLNRQQREAIASSAFNQILRDLSQGKRELIISDYVSGALIFRFPHLHDLRFRDALIPIEHDIGLTVIDLLRIRGWEIIYYTLGPFQDIFATFIGFNSAGRRRKQ